MIRAIFDTCAYRDISKKGYDRRPSNINSYEYGSMIHEMEKNKGICTSAASIVVWELANHLSLRRYIDPIKNKKANNHFHECYHAIKFLKGHINNNFHDHYLPFIQQDIAYGAKLAKLSAINSNIFKYNSYSSILAQLINNINNYDSQKTNWRKTYTLKMVRRSAQGFKDAGNAYLYDILQSPISKEEYISYVEKSFCDTVLFECLQTPLTVEQAKHAHPLSFRFLDVMLEKLYDKKGEHGINLRANIENNHESNTFVDAALLAYLHAIDDENEIFWFVTQEKAILDIRNIIQDSNHKILSLEEYMDELSKS